MPQMPDSTVGKRRRDRLRRHPIAVFVAVTFLISYGLGVPALFMVRAWAPSINDVAGLYLGREFVVIGPACGAVAAVAAASGSSAVGPFLRRRLLSPVRWWALFLPPAAFALVVTAYAAAGSSVGSLAAAIAEAWPLLLGHFLLQALTVGVGEEMGWRGWLLPTLAIRQGQGRAVLITGIIWYFWHVPILLGGVNDAFWFALAIGGLSILFALLWFRSAGSAMLPAIGHGSINAPIVFFSALLPQADHQLAWRILAGMLAVLGLIAVVCTRRQWATSPTSIQSGTEA